MAERGAIGSNMKFKGSTMRPSYTARRGTFAPYGAESGLNQKRENGRRKKPFSRILCKSTFVLSFTPEVSVS